MPHLTKLIVPSLALLFFSFTVCPHPAEAAQGNVPRSRSVPTGDTVSLLDSVRATLQEHRSLRAIQENRQVIRHEWDRAEKGYFPRVDVQAAAGFSQNSDTTTRAEGGPDSSSFYPGSRMSATLTQPIWDGLATRSRVRVAEATYDSMTQRVMDNGTTLALDAIISHIDILRTRLIVQLSRKNVERHNALLLQVMDRQRTGADSLADVSQAKSRLARAESQLADALQGMQSAEVTYFRLTNRDVRGMRLADVKVRGFTFADRKAVFVAAVENNPKLGAYLADVRAAKGGKELSEAAYQPTINVEAGPSYVDRGVGSNSSQWTQGVDAMLVMRWNIFNSGADKDAVEASSARIRQARQSMYSFQDDLKGAVDNTWVNMETARKQSGFYTDASRYSGETLRAYKEQFMLGQRSLLDVLDAENELYNNSVQAITAKHNVPVAQYRLMALSGELMEKLGIPNKELLDLMPQDTGPASKGRD